MGSQYVGHIDSENLVTKGGPTTVTIDKEEWVSIRIDQLVMLNGVFSLWILLQDQDGREVVAEYRNVGSFSRGEKLLSV